MIRALTNITSCPKSAFMMSEVACKLYVSDDVPTEGPVSSFKTLSISEGGSGLIFEGLTGIPLVGTLVFYQGFWGRKPSKIRPRRSPVEFFLG